MKREREGLGGKKGGREESGQAKLEGIVFFSCNVSCFCPGVIVAEIGVGNMEFWANSFCGISAILDSGFCFAIVFLLVLRV